jgi:hypothetical protein
MAALSPPRPPAPRWRGPQDGKRKVAPYPKRDGGCPREFREGWAALAPPKTEMGARCRWRLGRRSWAWPLWGDDAPSPAPGEDPPAVRCQGHACPGFMNWALGRGTCAHLGPRGILLVWHARYIGNAQRAG